MNNKNFMISIEKFSEKKEKKSEWNENRIESKMIENLLNLRKTENFKTRFWCKVEQYTTQNNKHRLFSSLKDASYNLVFLDFTYKYRVVYSSKVFNNGFLLVRSVKKKSEKTLATCTSFFIIIVFSNYN